MWLLNSTHSAHTRIHDCDNSGTSKIFMATIWDEIFYVCTVCTLAIQNDLKKYFITSSSVSIIFKKAQPLNTEKELRVHHLYFVIHGQQ